MGDACKLPFLDNTFDYIWSNAALEHIPTPWVASLEMIRVLKPGGIVIVQVPFLENLHSEPHDYYRFTIYGLRQLFHDTEEISSGVSAGPGQVVSDLIQYYFMNFANNTAWGWKSFFLTLICIPIGVALYPIKLFDLRISKRFSYQKWARAIYFVGKKT